MPKLYPLKEQTNKKMKAAPDKTEWTTDHCTLDFLYTDNNYSTKKGKKFSQEQAHCWKHVISAGSCSEVDCYSSVRVSEINCMERRKCMYSNQ